MIEYKYSEENRILIHYAQQFNDEHILKILERGSLENAVEAQQLASFFWRMVDQTVEDDEKNKTAADQSELESWCEYIMQTLRSHFIASGYLEIWDAEGDKA